MDINEERTTPYNSQYYKKHLSGSYLSAKEILKYLINNLPISSIIDFGCGAGTWCLAAKELGIKIITGIDLHSYDSSYMLLPQNSYLKYDLRHALNLNQKYDLVISVEVAEHIDNSYSNIFIENLCRHGDLILFSAAMPFQGGTEHINEQPCSYWMNIFKIHNYLPLDCIRPHFWNTPEVEIWYKNNCILYIKKEIYHRIIEMIALDSFPIDIVHPDMVKRIINKK